MRKIARTCRKCAFFLRNHRKLTVFDYVFATVLREQAHGDTYLASCRRNRMENRVSVAWFGAVAAKGHNLQFLILWALVINYRKDRID